MMKKTVLFLLLVLVFGCTNKYAKHSSVPEEHTTQTQSKETTDKTGTMESEGKLSSGTEGKITDSTLSAAAAHFPFELSDVFFDFDRYDIGPDAGTVLRSAADWLHKNKDVNLIIEGHCDDRGTNEYNLALGDRRANAVLGYMKSLGITPGRLKAISYGEEKPACSEQNESCWSRNRRAHLASD